MRDWFNLDRERLRRINLIATLKCMIYFLVLLS
jgi:hypothetical protein